ncbi:MAG: HD domain-containing protein [Nitrospirae bacterium]|nr:MAG: HD domain-containing protein [Nitrospirota bacterium]
MILPNYEFFGWTIQDPIHGGITFGPIEKAIIDHPLFQRLHGLRQNSLLYLVFPSANHTRFDHSLGVMSLSGKLFEHIIRNQDKILEAGNSRKTYQDPFRLDDPLIKQSIQQLRSDHYFKVALLASALFHDIGHGPLSHLFDRFFPSVEEVLRWTDIPGYKHIHARLSLETKSTTSISHEIMSCIVAAKVLSDIDPTLRHHGISTERMILDICAIIDDRIPPSDYFQATTYKTHSLLHEIISSDLDADRMDYLLRDSRMCGVNYGLYDPDRILKSMCTYALSDTGELHLAVRNSGLGALEDLLLSRYQMHGQIYCHKTNRACNAMLEKIRGRLVSAKWSWYDGCHSLDALLATFAGFNDHKFVDLLQQETADHGAGKVKEIAHKLFTERKLFKRAYEDRGSTNAPSPSTAKEAETRWRDFQGRLQAKGIRFTEDVFPNKGPKLHKPNYYLKVLKKHPSLGHYMVHELKDVSSVAHYLPELEITYRVYCKEPYVKEAKALLL